MKVQNRWFRATFEATGEACEVVAVYQLGANSKPVSDPRLTVVAALAVAWWIDRGAQAKRIDELEKAANTFNLGGDIDLDLALPNPYPSATHSGP